MPLRAATLAPRRALFCPVARAAVALARLGLVPAFLRGVRRGWFSLRVLMMSSKAISMFGSEAAVEDVPMLNDMIDLLSIGAGKLLQCYCN